MAEANAAIRVYEENKRGVKLLVSDAGIEVSFIIPPPAELRQSFLRYYHHMQLAVLRGVYPAPPLMAVGIVVGIVATVVASPSDSWWRSSGISWLIWRIGNFCIPFARCIPTSLYVAYLAFWGGFFALLAIMFTHRMVLRLLLSYRGFLYLAPRETSKVVMVWGALLKVFSGRNPLTYSFQDALPRLPVPALKDTIARYLESVHPLLSAEEFAKVSKMAQEFLVTDGPKFQLYLSFKSWWASNYVTDWWEKYVYLKGRSSLMINSNYYVLPSGNFTPCNNQLARAAGVMRQLMLFKQSLDREQLPPLLIRGIVPMCMSQYQRVFSTIRIPGREEDSLKKFSNSESKHAAIYCNGRFYKMPLYSKGTTGKLLTAYEMQRQLEFIQKASDLLDPVSDAERRIPALTSDNRTVWAENRETFFSHGINRRSLAVIESAVFVVVLDETVQNGWDALGKSLIHGDGGNRWFDKSFNLVVFKDGIAGMNTEHAWADAPVIAHLWEHCLTKEVIVETYDKKNPDSCRMIEPEEATSELHQCEVLQWDIIPKLEMAVTNSFQTAQIGINAFDLRVIAHKDYGKGLIKKFKVSPDAFVQFALQLAYYKNSNGQFTQTYEASMTRLYKEGRTETVRPVTDASKEFILAMNNADVSKVQKRKLLRIAGDKHQDLYRGAMSGTGVDRHLFTLYCVSVGFNKESEFLQDALRRPWKLSTSQQPQQQTTHWKAVAKVVDNVDDVFCPGGGFGPVADDGYGVSYMIAGEDNIFFHISSNKNSPETSSEKFAADLFEAFAELKAIWEE